METYRSLDLICIRLKMCILSVVYVVFVLLTKCLGIQPYRESCCFCLWPPCFEPVVKKRGMAEQSCSLYCGQEVNKRVRVPR